MEPTTISDAIKVGGWFWYRGWVHGGEVNSFLFKGTIRIVPANEKDGELPMIACFGLIFPPSAFVGEIWGPVVPPWKKSNA